jgi:hypothetical protein
MKKTNKRANEQMNKEQRTNEQKVISLLGSLGQVACHRLRNFEGETENIQNSKH